MTTRDPDTDPNQPARAGGSPFWRKVLWCVGVGAASLLLLLMATAWWANRKLGSALQRIRDAGEPVLLEDWSGRLLAPRRDATAWLADWNVAGGLDTDVVSLRAACSEDFAAGRLQSEILQRVKTRLRDPLLARQLSGCDLAIVAAWCAEARAAASAACAVRDFDGLSFVWPSLDPSGEAAVLPRTSWISGYLGLNRILTANACASALDGDAADAAEWLRLSFHAIRLVQDQPGVIVMGARQLALREVVEFAIPIVLAHIAAEFPLDEFDHALAEQQPLDWLRAGLIGERCIANSVFQWHADSVRGSASTTTRIRRPWSVAAVPIWFELDHANYLAAAERALRDAALVPVRAFGAKTLSHATPGRPEPSHWFPISMLLLPSSDELRSHSADLAGRILILRAAMALHSQGLEVAAHSAQAHRDPLTGAALRIIVDAEGDVATIEFEHTATDTPLTDASPESEEPSIRRSVRVALPR